jgi:hypothetical protein
MAHKVVFIRLTQQYIQLKHHCQPHSLDSIPHALFTYLSVGLYVSYNPKEITNLFLYSETGWWFLNIHVHTYFTERIWQVTWFSLKIPMVSI